MKISPYACHILLLTALITVAEPVHSASEAVEKQIPLPIGEITDMLVKWWGDDGYQIKRSEPKAESVRLNAIKDQENWQVDLAPHSALATRVIIICFSGMNPEIRQQQFWDHISQYILNPSAEEPRNSDHNIPTAVLSKMESVVCINARSDENDVQFSGFIIDTSGLVLCTAHDLGKSRDLTVTLYDGQEVKAKLLFKDPHLDLSILQMASKPKAAIRLSEGRNLLEMGEPVFTVGCPANLRGTVYAGTINSPPRKMNDQPLWQAHMDIYHGSSGSPVFDVNGKIVAMVKGRYRGTTSTAFLIPMETMLLFFKENGFL
jgi:serine protease Do